MRVLFTNWTLKGYGGSERWTYDMALALHNEGFNVEYMTKEEGVMSKRLQEAGIMPFSSYKYDLIIANHWSMVERLRVLQIEGFIIQTVHGTHPREERPHTYADKHFAISEEVAEFHNIEEVVYNSVDLQNYREITAPDFSGRVRVLCLCQGDTAINLTRAACVSLGHDFAVHNKRTDPKFDMIGLINKFDVVVGAGRGIIEAMACNRPVVVCDARFYYPRPCINLYMTDARQHNYSGRGGNSELLTKERLESAIALARGNTRRFAELHHDIKNAVECYKRYL